MKVIRTLQASEAQLSLLDSLRISKNRSAAIGKAIKRLLQAPIDTIACALVYRLGQALPEESESAKISVTIEVDDAVELTKLAAQLQLSITALTILAIDAVIKDALSSHDPASPVPGIHWGQDNPE